MLDFGIRSRRIFFLARLGSRSILGLRISFLGLGLYFLRLDCSFPVLGSVLGFYRKLFPLALTLVFLPVSPLLGWIPSKPQRKEEHLGQPEVARKSLEQGAGREEMALGTSRIS